MEVSARKEGGRAPNFSFAEVGIEVGAEIVSTLKPEEKAIVLDNKHIMFRGEKTSISAAALVLAMDMKLRDVTDDGHLVVEIDKQDTELVVLRDSKASSAAWQSRESRI